MAYTPTEWKSGDKVTSAKLNNIEQGIVAASGGGYDAVISVDIAESACVLESGNFAEAFAKVNANQQPIQILVYGLDTSTTGAVAIIYGMVEAVYAVLAGAGSSPLQVDAMLIGLREGSNVGVSALQWTADGVEVAS